MQEVPSVTRGIDGAAPPSPTRRNKRGRVIIATVVVVLAAAAGLVYVLTRPGRSKQASTQATTASSTQPHTAPATQTSARPATKPRRPTTQYFDVVQANYPRMPDTQPLAVPLDLPQAARLLLKERVHLSLRGDLWITRPDAPPAETVLARAAKEQGEQLALAVRDEVAFVHWMPRETGPWTFNLIARRPDGSGYELVTQSGRKPIGTPGRTYHWDRALDWNDKAIVATDTGVSVFQFEPDLRELHHELAAASADLAEPQFLLDWQGVLAWLPWEHGRTGGRGAARFVDDKWQPLGPEQGWPERLMHLVPLLDGNVLQIIAKDAGQVQVALASLEQLKVNEAEIVKQVEALSDPDDNVRQNAYRELTRYGPSVAPVLERLAPDQDPEAQARLRQLIKTQVEPTLGGMSLLGDQLRVVARLSDGGAVFYAEAGVMMAGDGDAPVFRTPAWLSLRPGQAAELLDPPMTTDMNPDVSRIYAFGPEWIVTNDVKGPQRYVGNGFEPLLRKSEVAAGLIEPMGIDRRGRWIFHRPAQPVELAPVQAPPAAPAGPGQPHPGVPDPGVGEPAGAPQPPATAPAAPGTQPLAPAVVATALSAVPAAGAGLETGPMGAAIGATTAADAATLIIDPTLPDPIPRLPVWLYATAETVGWDKDNWPVVKRTGAWALGEKGWRAMRSKDKMFTKPEEAPAPGVKASSEPAASPSPGPAGEKPAQPPAAAADTPGHAPGGPKQQPQPAPPQASPPDAAPAATAPADDLGPVLFEAPDATRYYDGRSTLRVVPKNGKRIDWPLPPAASGDGVGGKVYLVRARDGVLFLFNQPGRVVRIRPTPDGEEPFTVDATFTRNIPSADAITRVWLDPAGRIIMAYGNRLAIMFPGGYIPTAITRLMPPTDEADEP